MFFKRKFYKKIKYYTKNCKELTEQEIFDSSDLFSNHYGKYSLKSPIRPGEQIHLKPDHYRKWKLRDNYYVSFAYHGEVLIGHAYYLFIKTNQGPISWILQLVVHKQYRNHSIGKKLLLSVWGFSGDRAWGLATSNPLTVKTLESSTFRDVSIPAMRKNLNLIKQIAAEVDYLDVNKIFITENQSIVNSNFFVDHRIIKKNMKLAYKKNWKLGELPEGHEWIAFTFQGQELLKLNKKKIKNFISHSDLIIKEAYSRMKMPVHNWAKHHKSEVDFIITELNLKNLDINICDYGCGLGRHTFEFYSRGFKNIIGIDFSESNIKTYVDNSMTTNINFVLGDCRKYKFTKKFDLILCLYDVIGSFPAINDNKKIIKNIFKSLNKGGYAVITVMNMELTENLVKEKVDIYKNPKKLFTLKASTNMQLTGDVFKPEYILIDNKTEIIYRKEQFIRDGYLAAEYIVRDKRYRLNEIERLIKRAGFKIVLSRYVKVGNWDMNLKKTNLDAKEILLIVQKK